MVQLNKDNIQQILEGDKPVVIDVFATWCGPCLQMKPNFEAVAQELSGKYTFATLNVDEARELALQFNVTSVPTFIFIKDKKVVGKSMGYKTTEDLKQEIQHYLG